MHHLHKTQKLVLRPIPINPPKDTILLGWGGVAVIVVTGYLLVLVMRVMDLMINTEIVDCILQIKEKLISGPNFCLFYVDHSS